MNVGMNLYLQNILPIAVITLIVYVPLELVQAYMEYYVFDPEDIRATFRLQRFLENFFGIFAIGSVTALQAATLRHESISIGESLGRGIAAWPRLFWSRLVRGFLLILALLALVIPFFYYFVRLLLVEQVAVIEHASGMQCIKRAHHLSANHFWLVCGVTSLSYSAVILVALVLNIPLSLFPEIDHWLLSAAIAVFVQILTQIPTSLLVATYFEFLYESRAAAASVATASPVLTEALPEN